MGAGTNLGINADDQVRVAQGLARLLADTYTLYLKTHNFHWNVTGPMFRTLHLMFEEQYTEAWQAADVIAERIRALGAVAPGSYKTFAGLTTIPESEEPPRAREMIRQLADDNATVVRTARSIAPIADEAGDLVSADLLTRRVEVHEKNAWMLRALLDE